MSIVKGSIRMILNSILISKFAVFFKYFLLFGPLLCDLFVQSILGPFKKKKKPLILVEKQECAAMIQQPAANITLCPLGIIRAWLRAAPALQDGSAWRFILGVCVRFFFSQAGGRIPFIPYIVAVCRRPPRPRCLERDARPWCATLSAVPKAGQSGKSCVDEFQNQHYMHYCFLPSPCPEHTMKTTAAAMVSSSPS